MNTKTNATNTIKPQTAREIRAEAAASKARRDVKAEVRKDRRERLANATKGIVTPVFFLAIAIASLSGSFAHLRDLCILAGQDASHWYSPANSTPLIIDFMMLIASVQLRRVGITGTARFIARLCMTGGLVASVAGNLATGWLALPAGQSQLMTVIDLAVAVAPAVVLWGSVEMLTHTRKTAKVKARKASLVRRLVVALVARIERRLLSQTPAAPVQAKAPQAAAAPAAVPVELDWTRYPHPVVATTA